MLVYPAHNEFIEVACNSVINNKCKPVYLECQGAAWAGNSLGARNCRWYLWGGWQGRGLTSKSSSCYPSKGAGQAKGEGSWRRPRDQITENVHIDKAGLRLSQGSESVGQG